MQFVAYSKIVKMNAKYMNHADEIIALNEY